MQPDQSYFTSDLTVVFLVIVTRGRSPLLMSLIGIVQYAHTEIQQKPLNVICVILEKAHLQGNKLVDTAVCRYLSIDGFAPKSFFCCS